MQPLFIKPDLQFEKTAGEVSLPEDPAQWPQEILQELYKQVPYIADFQPRITMDRVSSERGYGFGQVELASKSEAQASDDTALQQAAGIRAVRIPVIIKESKLHPFDLFVNDAGKVLPLTENRLRQAMFRPQAFDITAQSPGDSSLIGMLYPPYRQSMGMGGSGLSFGLSSTPKMASAGGPSLFEATVDTYNKSDIDTFFHKLSSDLHLQAAYNANKEATLGPLSLLANCTPDTVEKRASQLAALDTPSVMQLTKTLDGYLLKTAHHSRWEPSEVQLTRRDVVQHFGDKIALAADESGQVTMAEGTVVTGVGLRKEVPATITEPGLYKVLDAENGKELVGAVITNLIDTDGEPVPVSLFTNGSHSAVQASIKGVRVGDIGNLPEAAPSGAGTFFSYTDDGVLQATVPLDLSNGSYSVGSDPSTLYGKTYDGMPVQVSVQDGIRTVMSTPEGKMLVPSHWKWVPLGSSAVVVLNSDDDAATPENTDAPKVAGVYVHGDGISFTFAGDAVEKLAAATTNNVDVGDAMFLLAGFGVDQRFGVQKLAAAAHTGMPQFVQIGRTITPARESWEQHMKTASEVASYARQCRRDLMKEASLIPDPTSVDTVLSLGFINAENLMTYVGYLPVIDSTQSKLCELLLGARVGMDLPAAALERAVRAVEEVIESLKVLAYQG